MVRSTLALIRAQLTDNPRLRGRQRGKRRDGALRPMFLRESDDRIDEEDGGDRQGIERFTEKRRRRARHEEQPDNRTGELPEQLA